MLKRVFATVLVALTVMTPPVAAEERRWTKLAGTIGEVDDAPPVRLASYALVWDAGQARHGYLRKGKTFVRTKYREALVAPGGRWVAGIPDYRLWRAVRKIDLMDRRTGRTHTVELPAPVTSPEWSADGRTLLLTAYKAHRDGRYTIVGFVTLNPYDRVPRLVRAGPRREVADWGIGHAHRFFFAGPGRVLARHDDKGKIAVYGLDGRRQRFYTGLAGLDERTASTVVSPSGRLFAAILWEGENGARRIGVVDARTGKVVHRLGSGLFSGWYDDAHVIVRRPTLKKQTFQRVALSGGARLDLIREKLVVGVADYEPHLERAQFVR